MGTLDFDVERTAQTSASTPPSLSVPQVPPALDTRVLQSPNVTSEAEQVARLLTGQPINPNIASTPPTPSPAAGGAAPTSPSPTTRTVSSTTTTGATQPIVVMPAPVVILPPRSDAKRSKPKSRFHPSRVLENLGNRISQAIPDQ